MANTIKIKRRAVGGAAGAPASLKSGELAYNEVDDTLYYGFGDSGGNATSIPAIAGMGAYLNKTSAQSGISGLKTFDTAPRATVDPSDNNDLTRKSWVDTQLALKANLASPTFTGTPAAPTAGSGTNTTQIATTAFVQQEIDRVNQGLFWKQSVRVSSASGVNVNISSAPSSIDGVTLSNGDRVLLQDQTAGAENGIYVFNGAASAMTRATDMDSSSEANAGAAVWVEEGSTRADSGWTLTTDSVTLGTTALVWAQIAGSATILGGAGLTKTGNTLDVNVDDSTIEINVDTLRIKTTWVGQTSITTLGTITTGTWNGTDIAVTAGGTGASDAATARTNLGAAASGANTDLTSIALNNTGLGVKDTDASHVLSIVPGSNLTANRTFTLTTGDAARTLDISAANVTVSSFGATLVDDADASTARTTLGLVIGTNVQAYDAELAALAGLTSAADALPYFTGSGTASTTTLTAFARTLLDDAAASNARTTLGLVIGTDVAAAGANTDITSLYLNNTGLKIKDTNASHGLIIAPGSDLTLDRTLTITTGDANRTLDISAASVTISSFAATLLDDAAATNMRTTLGLAIGTDVQAYDAELAAIAGLTSSADGLPYFTGSGTAAVATFTAFGRSLVDDVNASTARTTLGLVIGTDVQAYDAELAAIAGLVSAADRLPYFTGSGTASLATFTSFGRSLVDDADATAGRTTLGLGTMATQNASSVSISGGTIDGVTIDGGTF